MPRSSALLRSEYSQPTHPQQTDIRPSRSTPRQISGNPPHTPPKSFPPRDPAGCADAPQPQLPRRNPSPPDKVVPPLRATLSPPYPPAKPCARPNPSAKPASPPRFPPPKAPRKDFRTPWKHKSLGSCRPRACHAAAFPPARAILLATYSTSRPGRGGKSTRL